MEEVGRSSIDFSSPFFFLGYSIALWAVLLVGPFPILMLLGPSTTIFGLAHLLGISLMPRIKNWKDLTLFRPGPDVHYTHVDSLFSDTIDWDLIVTHLPDMIRVALSIKAGKIAPSTILRKLGPIAGKINSIKPFKNWGE